MFRPERGGGPGIPLLVFQFQLGINPIIPISALTSVIPISNRVLSQIPFFLLSHYPKFPFQGPIVRTNRLTIIWADVPGG